VSAPADAGSEAFAASRERFDQVVDWLAGTHTSGLTHAELETQLQTQGRELLRQLLQDHLDLRAHREERLEAVSDMDGVPRGTVEAGHRRILTTVFGEVTVTRLAYRRRGHPNLHPGDAALNLPAEKHSHGLRRLAAVEASRGSFDGAVDGIDRATGQQVGKRQVEGLAERAAADFDAFYAQRRPPAADPGDVLVVSADGKGIVMRPDGLRAATQKAAAEASPKLATRLSKGEKRNRKRMATVASVYDTAPAPRTPADILASADADERQPTPAPAAKDKWLTASVEHDAATVISQAFDEADRRDPDHTRTWVALVDGDNTQIERIHAEARDRDVHVPVTIDFVHVLEYLWSAAWCFYDEGDPAAETWVHDKAHAVLDGNAKQVAAAIRSKATRAGLDPSTRRNVDRAATYLVNKAPYLDYPTALAAGWPIATGVIEGACRHLIKDRMDITGARWSVQGAEAVLKLRALYSNDDFDEYWTYHLAQEQRRVHQSRYADSTIPQAA
jgi:hypothetical protein